MKYLFVLVASLCIGWGSLCHASTQERTFGYFDCIFLGNGDSAGGRFESGMDWTDDQIACVGRVMDTWMSILGATPGPTRNIRVVFNWDADNQSLASAGSLWRSEKTMRAGSKTYTRVACAAEALWRDQYVDPLSDKLDHYDLKVSLSMLNASSYYFGEDPAGLNGRNDAQSMILHEIGHGLGFTSNAMEWGKDRYFAWDLLMKREKNGTTILFDPDKSCNKGDTFYAGSENIEVYNRGATGSNMSHLDLTSNALMKPGLTAGKTQREPNEQEINLLREMGWKIGPVPPAPPAPPQPSVPEPCSSALCLAGLVMLLTSRRARTNDSR